MLIKKDINENVTSHNNLNETNKLDIFDHHFVSIFDIGDKDFINRKYKNRIVSGNSLITEMLQTRKQLSRIYIKSKCKSKTTLAKINYIDTEIKNVRKGQVQYMKQFYDYLERDWNDQTILKEDFPEPIQNVYKYDIYLSDGIDIIGGQITNKSSVVWAYLKYGTGIRPAEVGDQDLQSTLGAFPIDEGGSFSSIGDQIRLFCVLPETIQNADISEYSINEFAEGGKILSRTVLQKAISHLKKEDLPTITNVTYVIPHQDV